MSPTCADTKTDTELKMLGWNVLCKQGRACFDVNFLFWFCTIHSVMFIIFSTQKWSLLKWNSGIFYVLLHKAISVQTNCMHLTFKGPWCNISSHQCEWIENSKQLVDLDKKHPADILISVLHDASVTSA